MNENQPIIQVSNFRKQYKDFAAVDGLSFEVQRGEIFGLLGPNGAGKTSTLECLEGLRLASSGSLSVGGLDPARDARKLRHVIGVQLQSSGLPENITVDEAMRFFCAYHGVVPGVEWLERLGLGQKRRVQYGSLSTGQQRRLALALAVAHQPQVLFLDEPTAGLDVATRVELHKIMRELRAAGTTIILATHDMAEAEELADRIAILLGGKLAALGTPLEITATGAGLTRISVRTERSSLSKEDGPIPGLEQRTSRDGYDVLFSTQIGQTLAALLKTIESFQDTIIDLRVERPSLEDRFLEITSNGAAQ